MKMIRENSESEGEIFQYLYPMPMIAFLRSKERIALLGICHRGMRITTAAEIVSELHDEHHKWYLPDIRECGPSL